MGIANWKTWAVGDILTAADMNAYNRDNGRWLSHNATGGAPMCRVFDSAGAVGVASGASINFDSERFDIGAMHDTVTNKSRITVPTGGAGKYLIGAHVRYNPHWSAGNGIVGTIISANGGATDFAEASQIDISSTDVNLYQTVTTLVALAAADYVQVLVSWGTLVSVDVTATAAKAPEFWAIWMGE